MTSTQMDFLGLKEFKYDERAQDVTMVLQVANVGDIPIQIQLRNRQFDSAKVRSSVTFAANFRSRTKVLSDSMIS